MFDLSVKTERPEGENPLPQDSTAYLRKHGVTWRFLRQNRCTDQMTFALDELVSVPPVSYPRETFARARAFWTDSYEPAKCSLERR